MPKRKFKLSAGDDREVMLQWKGMWKDIQVTFDGQTLGTIENQKALKNGADFALPDGTTLNVQLAGSLQPELQLSRNGEPLPGSGGDPEAKLKLASGIVYFIGGLTLVLGLVAELGDISFLKNMGMNYVSAATGVVFLVLAFFISKRSALALGAAFALLIVDMALGAFLSMEAGGQVPTAGIVVRIFFLFSMFQGFGAIKTLKEKSRA